MAIGSIITDGYGPNASIPLVITMGYELGALWNDVVVLPPVWVEVPDGVLLLEGGGILLLEGGGAFLLEAPDQLWTELINTSAIWSEINA